MESDEHLYVEAFISGEAGKVGEIEPRVHVLRLNRHFKKLLLVRKHQNSHVSRAERCNQQHSAAVDTSVFEAWGRGAASLFESLSR